MSEQTHLKTYAMSWNLRSSQKASRVKDAESLQAAFGQTLGEIYMDTETHEPWTAATDSRGPLLLASEPLGLLGVSCLSSSLHGVLLFFGLQVPAWRRNCPNVKEAGKGGTILLCA